MGLSMPEATFVVHLDDFQGFVVKQKYPQSLTLNEKVLNLIFFEQQKEKKENLTFSEIEGLKITIYSSPQYPGWMVCSRLGPDEVFEEVRSNLSGSGRLILALISEDEDAVNLEELVTSVC